MPAVLAVIIPAAPNEPAARKAIPHSQNATEWLSAKIDGPLERVQLSGGRDMWISEPGQRDDLPVNADATRLAFLNGHSGEITGPAIILAHDGPDTTGLNPLQSQTTWAELNSPFKLLFT